MAKRAVKEKEIGEYLYEKFQSPWRLTSSAVFGTQFQTCKAGLTSNAKH